MEEIIGTFKDKKPYIIFSALLFCCGFILGFYLFREYPDYFLNNLDRLLGNILRVGREIRGRSPIYATSMIFQNNIRALIIIIFGGILLGVIPLYVILLNGVLVGVMLGINLYEGNTAAFFISAILPHGIFEIPAIIAGGAFGLKTGFNILFPGPHNRWKLLKDNLRNSVLTLGVLVPMLLIAAGIEVLITPHITKLFM